MNIRILHGDNRLRLKEFPDNNFDSGVCDPPYELGFMGKAWDKSGIAYNVSMWKEVYRVLKPGAHLLAFGGSRTYHRMACAIEDAGFQIRDQIMWLYGSGFPKSLDISKALDKAAGAAREVVGIITEGRVATPRQDIRGGKFHASSDAPMRGYLGNEITAPATDLARQWEGWGTALKPAHEPIVVARKPLEGTVVNNVLKHGCGGINVAGCLVEIDQEDDIFAKNPHTINNAENNIYGTYQGGKEYVVPAGRWPANVIHDGSPEVLAAFPTQTSQTGNRRNKNRTQQEAQATPFTRGQDAPEYTDGGSPVRFFYCAKASPAERGRSNFHPTVKPLALMCYLVRMVTPPGGLGLDMFCGSGSSLIAYAKEGFDAVGIDLEIENCENSERRCLDHLGMLAEIKRS